MGLPVVPNLQLVFYFDKSCPTRYSYFVPSTLIYTPETARVTAAYVIHLPSIVCVITHHTPTYLIRTRAG